MNILLAAVNAKYIHSNLAVYSLKASAGPYEPLVKLAEYTINHQTDEIFGDVCRHKPKLLFFSCYIWNRQVILETAENVRKVLPDVVIWAGGPEVSYDARTFLQENPAFDGVMTGEGERTFRSLLSYYVDGIGTLQEIPGLVYRQAGRITDTGSAPLMESLDELPFVYSNLADFENRIIYYESSRGCPFSCSYCLSSIDKSVRFRSTELVKRELAFFLEHRVPQVKFVDRTFNCNHAHAAEIWRFIREHDNGVTNFHFEIEADLLNEEELALLAGMRPGLVQLEVGVQTVNPRTLAAICRTAKYERIADRVRRIAAHQNIHQHLDLIAGLPYEDFESFQNSFDTVYCLHPQELQLGFLKVLKGSAMHVHAAEYGIVYRSAPPYEVLATRWISWEELLRLKEVEEMLEVYYNSRQFDCTIAALERLFARPFALYEALADFYAEKGLNGKAWSRMQRFLHLREFAREQVLSAAAGGGCEPDMRACDGTCESEADEKACSDRCEPEADVRSCGSTCRSEADEKACSDRCEPEPDVKSCGGVRGSESAAEALRRIDECLTLDVYLRENAKSRPQWAPELSAYREAAVRFYQREEETYEHLPAYRGLTWKQMMRMTHLERFSYDVTGGGEKRESWLLFDYRRRNPLTKDAAVIRVRPEQV